MKRRFSIPRYSPKFITLAITLAVAIPLAANARDAFPREHADGMVYALTNAAAGNSVLAFERRSDGSLTSGHAFRTGGNGSGVALGTQGALALSDSGHWLFAVNPGSNSVSVFLVFGNFLLHTDTETSGGAKPVSVTVKDDVVYVLNSGTDNLQGFHLDLYGHLTPIVNSARSLGSPGTAPAEVDFNRDGDLLAVTEKATNKVLTYPVDGDGLLGPVTITNSPAPTPFGFAFGRRDQMLVSEASGGAPGASTLSSYQLTGSGAASLITTSLPNHQSAACWVVVTRDGRYAYTSNTASDNLSTYGVTDDGELSLIKAIAAHTGHVPLDLALDRNDRHLYALNGGSGTISAYAIGADGSLRLIENQASTQLTGAASGLVAH